MLVSSALHTPKTAIDAIIKNCITKVRHWRRMDEIVDLHNHACLSAGGASPLCSRSTAFVFQMQLHINQNLLQHCSFLEQTLGLIDGDYTVLN